MAQKLIKLSKWLMITLITLIFCAPFYIAIVYSFKSPQETAETGLAFPKVFHWENYSKAIEVSNFYKATLNSVIVTAITVTLIVVICSMAAYVIARNSHNKFYNSIYYVCLAAMMLPFQVIMMPLYTTLRSMSLLNTLGGLVLAIGGMQIAYNIFIYTGFMKSIPKEMDEAAFIDGAGTFRTFWTIIFPLAKPITSTAIILNALTVWNEFAVSLVVVQKQPVRTLPLTQFYFFGEHSIELNMAFAAFILGMIPIIILYVIMQKYIISGVMSGAVKG